MTGSNAAFHQEPPFRSCHLMARTRAFRPHPSAKGVQDHSLCRGARLGLCISPGASSPSVGFARGSHRS